MGRKRKMGPPNERPEPAPRPKVPTVEESVEILNNVFDENESNVCSVIMPTSEIKERLAAKINEVEGCGYKYQNHTVLAGNETLILFRKG